MGAVMIQCLCLCPGAPIVCLNSILSRGWIPWQLHKYLHAVDTLLCLRSTRLQATCAIPPPPPPLMLMTFLGCCFSSFFIFYEDKCFYKSCFRLHIIWHGMSASLLADRCTAHPNVCVPNKNTMKGWWWEAFSHIYRTLQLVLLFHTQWISWVSWT